MPVSGLFWDRRVYSVAQKGEGEGTGGRVERKGWAVVVVGMCGAKRSSIWSCSSSVNGGS